MSSGVRVLGGLEQATDNITTVLSSATKLGFPVVVKDVEGGGAVGSA